MSPYFFLPLRVVVVVVYVVTRPLFFAQAGEQYHFSGGGCFNQRMVSGTGKEKTNNEKQFCGARAK
jgi:hypothetical protein